MSGEPALKVTNLGTGRSITVPIDERHQMITASAFTKLSVTNQRTKNSEVLRIHDPGFLNTVVCKSQISLVDGENGELYYRGYGVKGLMENCTFLEVAFLLIHGRLPAPEELRIWEVNIYEKTLLRPAIAEQFKTFRHDAHPMGMVMSALAAEAAFVPGQNPALSGDALYTSGPKDDLLHRFQEHYDYLVGPGEDRLERSELKDVMRQVASVFALGRMTIFAANAMRVKRGASPVHSFSDRCGIPDYVTNFLYMLDKEDDEDDFKPDPKIASILNRLFICLAEHGSSCSTITMRHLTSSGVDPTTALVGSLGALFGERKCHDVIRMLRREIRKMENISEFISLVKRRRTSPAPPLGMDQLQEHMERNATSGAPGFGDTRPREQEENKRNTIRLQGFGSRIYKTTDPRADIVKKLALEAYAYLYPDAPSPESKTCQHIIGLALQVEEQALKDRYFRVRNLYPNIDFWTAVLLDTLGFEENFMPVVIAIPRVAGCMAHWSEFTVSEEFRIFRPRQKYVGHNLRPYRFVGERGDQQPGVDLAGIGEKSNPQAALRRVATDNSPIEDIQNLVYSTRESIAQLRHEVQLAQEKSGPATAPATPRPQQTRTKGTPVAVPGRINVSQSVRTISARDARQDTPTTRKDLELFLEGLRREKAILEAALQGPKNHSSHDAQRPLPPGGGVR